MNMKKLLALLLAVLLIGFFAACAGTPDNTDTGNDEPTPTPAPAEDVVASPEPEDAASPDNLDPFPEDRPASPEDLVIFPEADPLIIHDLAPISLFNHSLDSDLLESITLRSPDGDEVANVLIINDWDDLTHIDGHIFNDAWAIEIYYFAREGGTAAQNVLESFEADKRSDYFHQGSRITMGDIHTNADESMASLSLVEEFENGNVRVLLYLAQALSDTDDFVLMELVFYPHLWESIDSDILAALSHYIGIDMSVYLADFI